MKQIWLLIEQANKEIWQPDYNHLREHNDVLKVIIGESFQLNSEIKALLLQISGDCTSCKYKCETQWLEIAVDSRHKHSPCLRGTMGPTGHKVTVRLTTLVNAYNPVACKWPELPRYWLRGDLWDKEHHSLILIRHIDVRVSQRNNKA